MGKAGQSIARSTALALPRVLTGLPPMLKKTGKVAMMANHHLLECFPGAFAPVGRPARTGSGEIVLTQGQSPVCSLSADAPRIQSEQSQGQQSPHGKEG